VVSVENIWQNNQSQSGISFGYDETLEAIANPTGWLTMSETKRMIKTSKSDKFIGIFASYPQCNKINIDYE
jgi:hypothetical protein